MANKLTTALTQSGTSIKETRAAIIAEDMQSAQTKLLQKLNDELRGLNRKLNSLSDFYPDSELSLRVVKDNFNPEQWATDLQNLEVQVLNKSVEIKTAQATYDKWFTDEATETISK